MKKLLKYSLLIAFISCQNKPFEISFDTYNDYKTETNLRLTGWFPNIIKSDSYNLKSGSHLGSCNFVKFNYSNNKTYDSLFLNSTKVPLFSFQQKIKKYDELKPNWFPDYNEINNTDFEIIKTDRYDIARKKSTHEIFCFCEN
ncbi:hypothetical protein SAMN06265349_104215 [Flavobacterium resistens]|uniref:Uncharacterized protein n=1 Tax=Flavobacterium resistens TaxID=443612 RepID=A0A521E7W0_9FLAO|nr:hypothetical protein [Flavobacterium resistens]MRX69100.1 hypothetical protein [Flavobacterium resistens]SMO80036.1 hypothetical protein SAMN06265349_104215 [Flavobacterium resistens]